LIYKNFSERQRLTLTWWKNKRFAEYDGIICDGSIRSGKTISMAIGFILWSMMHFDNEKFALCGRTIESLRRNVITYIPTWLEGLFTVTERRSENKMIVTACGKTNTYYLFGGRDESSYTLIQGITLAGVLFDEVALMPRSFVEQAMARCSVSGSKFWFNCNPESPQHWFYTEWIKKAYERNMLYLHFTMEDNLSLDNKIKARYEGMYSGVFYDRYIRGLWVVAEGLVYTMFNQNIHITDKIPKEGRYFISVDYGTLNPFSAGLWCLADDKAYRIDEYYYSGREKEKLKTDEDYYTEIDKLAGGRYIERIIVDPSAASFKAVINKYGKYAVRDAKNSVVDGIRYVSGLLKNNRMFISSTCKNSKKEFAMYRWDTKAKEDKPMKENDHAMDDIRYFAYTVLSREWRQ